MKLKIELVNVVKAKAVDLLRLAMMGSSAGASNRSGLSPNDVKFERPVAVARPSSSQRMKTRG